MNDSIPPVDLTASPRLSAPDVENSLVPTLNKQPAKGGMTCSVRVCAFEFAELHRINHDETLQSDMNFLMFLSSFCRGRGFTSGVFAT